MDLQPGSDQPNHSQLLPRMVKSIALFLITIGIVFRFVNLNHKVYWHDEVYTTFRAAGYTRQAIDQTLFQNQVIQFGDLQKFQHIKPYSTYSDTLRSLALEDPQHPPLYFWLTRAWMQALDAPLKTLFHSSLTTQRSLPAWLSLLSLPLMYGLAWELFASRSAAWMATTLLALSPFDVLFAQTARQYSLLTVMVIASSYCLLQALRSQWRLPNTPPIARSWLLYSCSLILGLYTHPFFGLTIGAHILYMLALTGLELRQRWRQCLGFSLMTLGAIVAYLPWLWVMLTNQQRALATTDWTDLSPGWDYLLKLWILSFTALLVDLDFGWNNPVTVLLRLPFLLLMGWALWRAIQTLPRPVWLFLLTGLVPWLLLALPDVVWGGKRSTVSRYLISCYPSLQLAVAYGLSTLFFPGRGHQLKRCWVWGVAGLLAIAALTSLTASAAAFSWWNKDLSYFNDQVAHRIRALDAAIVLTDMGDDFTNTGDLISLSYLLPAHTSLLPLRLPLSAPTLNQQLAGKTAIVFRPSQRLRENLEVIYGQLQPLYLEGRLWKVDG